jgi:ketosteroid isomerase-like protein
MSQENVEKVRTTFEAYRRGDYARGTKWLAPDVTWENGQELPANGPAAVREMWKRWDSEWEELETFAEEFIDAGTTSSWPSATAAAVGPVVSR